LPSARLEEPCRSSRYNAPGTSLRFRSSVGAPLDGRTGSRATTGHRVRRSRAASPSCATEHPGRRWTSFEGGDRHENHETRESGVLEGRALSRPWGNGVRTRWVDAVDRVDTWRLRARRSVTLSLIPAAHARGPLPPRVEGGAPTFPSTAGRGAGSAPRSRGEGGGCRACRRRAGA